MLAVFALENDAELRRGESKLLLSARPFFKFAAVDISCGRKSFESFEEGFDPRSLCWVGYRFGQRPAIIRAFDLNDSRLAFGFDLNAGNAGAFESRQDQFRTSRPSVGVAMVNEDQSPQHQSQDQPKPVLPSAHALTCGGAAKRVVPAAAWRPAFPRPESIRHCASA